MLKKESIVLCHQIRTLDRKRLIRELGKISDQDLKEEIISAVCFQLGVDNL